MDKKDFFLRRGEEWCILNLVEGVEKRLLGVLGKCYWSYCIYVYCVYRLKIIFNIIILDGGNLKIIIIESKGFFLVGIGRR